MSTAYEAIMMQAEACSGDDIFLKNGTKFVRHLAEDQALRFFHKIFAPISDEGLRLSEQICNFKLPCDYKTFLLRCGGATLFDRSFYIYGYDPAISRTLRLEDQRPVFCGSAQNEFRTSYPHSAENGWFAVGSIVLEKKLWVAVNKHGEAAIIGFDRIITFDSFDVIINQTISTLDKEFRCQSISEEKSVLIQNILLNDSNYQTDIAKKTDR